MSSSNDAKSSRLSKMFSSLHQALTSKAVSQKYHCEDLIIPRANYRTHLRRTSTFHTIMPSNVQDLPAKDEVNVLNKHTGFPEPLSSGKPHLQTRQANIDLFLKTATLPSPTLMQTPLRMPPSKQRTSTLPEPAPAIPSFTADTRTKPISGR